MNFLNLPPSLRRPRADRIDLTFPLAARLIYAGVGIMMLTILARSLSGYPVLFWMFGIVIGASALNEERWIFDLSGKELRRRFGFLIFARSWAIDLDDLISIELDGEADDFSANDPYGKLVGGYQKNHIVLKLILQGGRNTAMYVVHKKHYAKLAEYGKAIAELTGKPFVEV